MEDLIEVLETMAGMYNQEQEDSSDAIFDSGEIDRGHTMDCYESGHEDGVNFMRGVIKNLLKEHLEVS